MLHVILILVCVIEYKCVKQGWIHWGGVGGGVCTPPLALARGGCRGGANFHIKYLNIKQLSLNKFTKLY